MSLLTNPLMQSAALDGISYSGVLTEIGGTQLRWKCDDASGDMTEVSNPTDPDYEITRTVASNASVAAAYRQTSGAPVWDDFGGTRVGGNIGIGVQNFFSSASADAVTALKAMSSGFIACWILPNVTSNDGAIWSLSEDASLGKYAMLRRSGTDTVQLIISSATADNYRVGVSGLTFGAPMFVVARKTAGAVWTLWINGSSSGSSTAAAGSATSAYWLDTVTTANLQSLGFLKRDSTNNACTDDVLYDLTIGDTAPTDQQIADLYAAVLP